MIDRDLPTPISAIIDPTVAIHRTGVTTNGHTSGGKVQVCRFPGGLTGYTGEGINVIKPLRCSRDR